MRIKKSGLLSVIILIVVLALGGCSMKLKTSDDALRYARMNYGSAELISEQNNGENSVTFTLKDKDHGFTYTVTSKITEMNIDGSSFGKYESTSDDYMSCFRDFILDDSSEKFDEIKNRYNIETEIPDISLHSLMHIHIKNGDTADAKDAAVQTAEIFKSYEKKKLFAIYDVSVFDENDNIIGKCNISDGKWQNAEELYDERIISWAKNKSRNADYLYKEKKTFKDTGLSLGDVVKFYYDSDINCPQEPDDEVTCYYFKAGNKEFFVYDFWTVERNEWYTNYYEVFNRS